MKASLRSEAAFDAPGQEVAPPALAILPGARTRQRRRTSRKPDAARDRVRSIITVRAIVTTVCLGLFVAVQRYLAVMFDDELAALIFTMTLALSVVASAKPLIEPGRRR